MTATLRTPAEEGRRYDAREHEIAEFDEHEEWPTMFEGCESRPTVLDHKGANDNRFASIRTVRRTP
jgi:hypothetical protein